MSLKRFSIESCPAVIYQSIVQRLRTTDTQSILRLNFPAVNALFGHSRRLRYLDFFRSISQASYVKKQNVPITLDRAWIGQHLPYRGKHGHLAYSGRERRTIIYVICTPQNLGDEGIYESNCGGLVLACIEADFASQYSFCSIW